MRLDGFCATHYSEHAGEVKRGEVDCTCMAGEWPVGHDWSFCVKELSTIFSLFCFFTTPKLSERTKIAGIEIVLFPF